MKQTSRASLIETISNTVFGYAVALGGQLVVFPLVGVHVTIGTNLAMGAGFTVVSVVRGYLVRRLFEHLRVKGILQ